MMELFVVDTHALLWYLSDDPRLGRKVSETFEFAERGRAVILVPTIVLAESLHILEKKKLRLNFDNVLRAIENNKNYFIVSLDIELIRRMIKVGVTLELHDRIIVTLARQWDAKILTKDRKIGAVEKIKTLW